AVPDVPWTRRDHGPRRPRTRHQHGLLHLVPHGAWGREGLLALPLLNGAVVSQRLSRRSFLKAVAVTGAAASGCGDLPSRQLMPHVIPDENVIPGVPAFFASACRECGAGCGVVARVREGRVIKLEGNPQDPVGGGALCARGQAALQGLYNPDRLSAPRTRGRDGALAETTWDDALALLSTRLGEAARAGRERVAFLAPLQGPTLDDLV